MKRLLLITLTLIILIPVSVFGQGNGSIKFLGIPIDGTESQFISKLRNKGFVYSPACKSYKGQFNGQNVDVLIHTNHNLVDRVYVAFPFTTAENIRIEFNTLLSQFKTNSKYLDLSMNEQIPDNEDISYQIAVNKKRYQATFYYFNPDMDSLSFASALIDKCDGILPSEDISKWKESIVLSEEEQELQANQIIAQLQDSKGNIDEDKALLFITTLINGAKSLADGEVWFMIHENYGRYCIGLYYDNLHNQAHGEDL